MSNRIPRRRRIGSFKHKKGNTPYKWYNPDKRDYTKDNDLLPEDQAHIDSIREEIKELVLSRLCVGLR